MPQDFLLPVLPDLVPNLATVMVQPAGVVKQFLLQEDRLRMLMRRLMQVTLLSTPVKPGSSTSVHALK